MSKDTNLWSKYFPFFSLQSTFEAAFTMLPNVPHIRPVAGLRTASLSAVLKFMRAAKR